MAETITTRILRRLSRPPVETVQADICVLGSGISGIAAALEAAKLGRKVVIVDGAPSLGGQAIGSSSAPSSASGRMGRSPSR
jgi:heterodisulfide reductase subunit A-like polyferredoxin